MSPTIAGYSNWKAQLPHSKLHLYFHLRPYFPWDVPSQWQSMAKILSRLAPRRRGTPLTGLLWLEDFPVVLPNPLKTFYWRLTCFHQPSFLSFTFNQRQTYITGWQLSQSPTAPYPFSLILSCHLLLRVGLGVIRKNDDIWDSIPPTTTAILVGRWGRESCWHKMVAQIAKDFTSGTLGNIPVKRNTATFFKYGNNNTYKNSRFG